MKIYISFIILLCFSNCSIAQPPAGTNVYHNELTKFTGTWRWGNNGDTVTFRLNKENVKIPGLSFGEDFIIGFHQIKHGNTIVESSLQYQAESILQGHSTITGAWPSWQTNSKVLEVRTKDISKNKDDFFILTLNSDNTEMKITRFIQAGGMRPGPMPAPGFTMPDSITLKKVTIPPISAN